MRKTGLFKRLALVSVFSALYLILCFLDIKIGTIKITLASFVIYFVSFCFPISDAFLMVFLGAFLNQLFYGLTPTTILWMMPPFVRPLFIIPLRKILENHGVLLDQKKILSVGLILVTSLFTTLANTGVLYLDSIIIGYDYRAVFLQVVFQALTTMATGLVETTLLFPLLRALRKAKLIDDEDTLRSRILEHGLKK